MAERCMSVRKTNTITEVKEMIQGVEEFYNKHNYKLTTKERSLLNDLHITMADLRFEKLERQCKKYEYENLAVFAVCLINIILVLICLGKG